MVRLRSYLIDRLTQTKIFFLQASNGFWAGSARSHLICLFLFISSCHRSLCFLRWSFLKTVLHSKQPILNCEFFNIVKSFFHRLRKAILKLSKCTIDVIPSNVFMKEFSSHCKLFPWYPSKFQHGENSAFLRYNVQTCVRSNIQLLVYWIYQN